MNITNATASSVALIASNAANNGFCPLKNQSFASCKNILNECYVSRFQEERILAGMFSGYLASEAVLKLLINDQASSKTMNILKIVAFVPTVAFATDEIYKVSFAVGALLGTTITLSDNVLRTMEENISFLINSIV